MRVILLIVGLLFMTWQLKSQCITDSSIQNFQILPNSHLQPCVEVGNQFDAVLSFDVSEDALPTNISIEVVFDSIIGLPDGITYEFDQPNRTYWNNIKGCITFTGITYDAPGRYFICIYGTSYVYDLNAPTRIGSGELIEGINQALYTLDSVLGITHDSVPRPFFDVISLSNQCDHSLLDSINSNIHCADVIISSVSNLKNENPFVSAFPNPANDLISFHFNQFIDKLAIQIFNPVGQVILHSKNNSGVKVDLRVSSLSKGIYFYRLLLNDKQLQIGKLIIN